jgi:cytochrome c biogenesis protein CcmG, thiol:disulfide interchange protein DsbE
VSAASLRPAQWWALLGVGVLLLAAVALREDAPGPEPAAPLPAAAPAPGLAALRMAAALEPCPPGLGGQMPDLSLPCLGGGPDVELRSAPPGRPTLVNVWASWCAPCADEVPELVAFRERAGDRVALVGVLTTDVVERGLAFSADFGMRWPSLVDDDGEVLRAFPPGPPVTLFLDAQGRVVHTRSGAFRDLAEVERLVADHLGVRL